METLAKEEIQQESDKQENWEINQKLNSDFEATKTIKRSNTPLVCRICLGDDDEPIDNPLITPCKCAGTMSCIHIKCLIEWLN